MATSPPDIFAQLLDVEPRSGEGMVETFAQLRFHYRSGQMDGSRVGTAFCVNGWNRTLLTAAHNVRLEAGESALRIELTFASADPGKGPSTIYARAYAHPNPYALRSDVAVIVLTDTLSVANAPVYGRAPSQPFDAEVVGFAAPAQSFQRVPVRARRAGAFYDYIEGATEGGQSGGPLIWTTAEHGALAVGIHLKRFGESPARSWAHDKEQVVACRNAATNIIPKV